jgi:hypothetical protein
MKARTLVLLAAIMIGGLTGAIQVKQFVGSLQTSDGWLLAEKDQRVVLIARTGDAALNAKGTEPVWHISSPHLQTPSKKFLAIEETNAGIRLSLSEKKSASTRWAIDVLSSTSPKNPKRGSIDERQMLTGTSSKSFRLRLFNGPHEGWFLAAEPVQEDSDTKPKQSSNHREWRITQDPKQAIRFDYVDTKYSIEHK